MDIEKVLLNTQYEELFSPNKYAGCNMLRLLARYPPWPSSASLCGSRFFTPSAANTVGYIRQRARTVLLSTKLHFSLFRVGKRVVGAGNQYVQGGQQDYAEEQVCYQSADNYDGERPL